MLLSDILVWVYVLFPGSVTGMVPVHRDGEVVNISRYACCSDESCCCKSSIGSKDLSCTAVTLKLWKGFYHERCSDIMKVLSTTTPIFWNDVKLPHHIIDPSMPLIVKFRNNDNTDKLSHASHTVLYWLVLCIVLDPVNSRSTKLFAVFFFCCILYVHCSTLQ